MANAIAERRQVARQFQRAGGSHGMADKALRVVESRAVRAAEDQPQGDAFLRVAGGGAGGVCAHHVDAIGGDPGPLERRVHALRLPLGIGQDKIAGVAVHRIADELAMNSRAAGFGVRQPFEHVQAASFGDDDASAVQIERPRRLGRIVMPGQCALALEAGENSERADAFRHAASDRHVAFAQQQHLAP